MTCCEYDEWGNPCPAYVKEAWHNLEEHYLERCNFARRTCLLPDLTLEEFKEKQSRYMFRQILLTTNPMPNTPNWIADKFRM